eukprot:12459414-Alexandrium_andersonii.AAC.1
MGKPMSDSCRSRTQDRHSRSLKAWRRRRHAAFGACGALRRCLANAGSSESELVAEAEQVAARWR